MTELQLLRAQADRLFAIYKAKNRLFELYSPDVTLDQIRAAQANYNAAEKLCQMKRKELGLPYHLNED